MRQHISRAFLVSAASLALLNAAGTANGALVLNGGFAPGTAGNPRPYGMPPFSHALNDVEVAQVVSYLRSAWGNNAPPVESTTVNRYRNVPLE